MRRNYLYYIVLLFLFNIINFAQEKVEVPTIRQPLNQSDNLPEGWAKGGDQPQDYTVGLDRTLGYVSSSSAYITSRVFKPVGYATLQQSVQADNYKGDRIEFSGYVLTKLVEFWSGLFMKVEDSYGRVLAYDNMENRPVVGTSDWQKCSIVLDVPKDASKITYGALLSGKGQINVDSLSLKVVNNTVPVTDLTSQQTKKYYPENMDFEK